MQQQAEVGAPSTGATDAIGKHTFCRSCSITGRMGQTIDVLLVGPLTTPSGRLRMINSLPLNVFNCLPCLVYAARISGAAFKEHILFVGE